VSSSYHALSLLSFALIKEKSYSSSVVTRHFSARARGLDRSPPPSIPRISWRSRSVRLGSHSLNAHALPLPPKSPVGLLPTARYRLRQLSGSPPASQPKESPSHSRFLPPSPPPDRPRQPDPAQTQSRRQAAVSHQFNFASRCYRPSGHVKGVTLSRSLFKYSCASPATSLPPCTSLHIANFVVITRRCF
jgi:hypothetical protein